MTDLSERMRDQPRCHEMLDKKGNHVAFTLDNYRELEALCEAAASRLEEQTALLREAREYVEWFKLWWEDMDKRFPGSPDIRMYGRRASFGFLRRARDLLERIDAPSPGGRDG